MALLSDLGTKEASGSHTRPSAAGHDPPFVVGPEQNCSCLSTPRQPHRPVHMHLPEVSSDTKPSSQIVPSIFLGDIGTIVCPTDPIHAHIPLCPLLTR